MSPQAEIVTSRLIRTWRRWWGFSLWSGLVLLAAASIAVLVALTLVDALVQLPRAILIASFLAWLGLTLTAVLATFVRLKRGRRTLAGTARRVEMAFPELESHLINIVLFAGQGTDGHGADTFRQAAVDQAAAAVADFPFEQAAERETRWRRFLLCMQTPRDLAESLGLLATLVLLTVLLGMAVPAWASSARRLLHPFTFVPRVGSVRIVKVTPGDAEVLLGSSLQILAEIGNPAGKSHAATLYLQHPGKPEAVVPMLPDETHRRYVAALPQVLGPFHYRLQVGDSQTDRYGITVYERPSVIGVDVTYDFPAYLRRTSETLKQDQADLQAPQFTRASLKIHPSAPIVAGSIVMEGKTFEGQLTDDGKALAVALVLKDNANFTIHLTTRRGHVDPQPRVNRVKVVADAPPTLQLLEPARELSVGPGSKTPVVVRAADDLGLGRVTIEMREAGTPKASERAGTIARWDKLSTTGSVFEHALSIDSTRFKPGETLWVRALAQDLRQVDLDDLKLGPQESSTAWQKIVVVAAEARARSDLARLEGHRVALARILADQLRTRVTTAGLPKLMPPDDTGRAGDEIRGRQVAIQRSASTVLANFGQRDEPDEMTARRVVNKLAFGEMVQAIRQAEAVLQVKVASELAKPASALMATQDRIIDVLRRLLNELRLEQSDLLAEMKKRPDTAMPSDVKDKLNTLKDKLGEFLKQQKKVIEATENLAKKSVEDYTEKDKQLLKELAAIEDDWANFTAEKHTDLSKLPEQDFSNPSLLKELIEVQTELKMARDALTKKTVDIAVPLEQLGAEMAKEMTTNLEKWLPDTPDRERWSQEEPLTGDMKEAPMAELPREMEDIVGKLMEDEEDLFDEMEDATSSWIDSIDKGAGWDAMDGPISNNSARGVTGNRLPNTSEIGGRSGEGRQGKSSGEFVGDTAVGKGGRLTPSRLTPDPYVKGQVKDVSKDPVGGATGGGKESGQGGEGLHGPAPKRPDRELGRLAQKQAQLRNRAEGLDLKFQVMKYHHTDLRKMVDAMAATERDLRAGRYRNALRRRDVLIEGLGQVKTYLKGEFKVRQDQTANLPTDIQKEILGSMQEPSPPGWEELNRQYFERLAAPEGTAVSRGKP